MAKKMTLGRGLDSLLDATLSPSTSGEQVTSLEISDVVSGHYQPRSQFEDESLRELAESIKEHGVIQPILVRRKGPRYEIVAGERRWRASGIAGLDKIPAIIREISDENSLAIGLIENIQRQNLNPIDEAQGLVRLQEEFGLTQERIAGMVGRSRSSISNTMRLLNLPDPIQDYLREKKLDMGQARALITLPLREQLELAHKAVKAGWSAREMEKRAGALKAPRAVKPKKRDPESQALGEKLSQFFGLKVSAREDSHKKGKGTLTFNFGSYAELEQLLKKMGFHDFDS